MKVLDEVQSKQIKEKQAAAKSSDKTETSQGEAVKSELAKSGEE